MQSLPKFPKAWQKFKMLNSCLFGETDFEVYSNYNFEAEVFVGFWHLSFIVCIVIIWHLIFVVCVISIISLKMRNT